jgi:purine-binding chemotaxis protein CheW
MAEIKIVTFSLGKEKYGLDIMKIDAVAEFEEVTSLPQTADFIEGIINFRKREVLPLINLRRKFKLPDFENKELSKVIVIKMKDRKIGVMVDEVKEVMSLSPDKIEEKPSVGGMRNTQFISGIAKIDNHMIIILDINKLLTEEEKIEISEVVSS